MRRGFPYGTSITCKKEGKIYVEGRILRSVTMSRDSLVHARSHGSHLPRGNSCTKCTTRKAKKRVLIHILSVLTHIHDQ